MIKIVTLDNKHLASIHHKNQKIRLEIIATRLQKDIQHFFNSIKDMNIYYKTGTHIKTNQTNIKQTIKKPVSLQDSDFLKGLTETINRQKITIANQRVRALLINN